MAVVNPSGGAEEVNGIRLYGLDAEIHRKLEAKRNPGLEKALAEWVASVAGEPLEQPEDPISSLQSGILLCKLVNTIRPGIIRKFNTRRIPLLEMENIGLYLKACWELGVPSSDLFVTSDLYLRKGVSQVFQNLESLARIAQSIRSFKGPYFKVKRVMDEKGNSYTGAVQEKRKETLIADVNEDEQRRIAHELERQRIMREEQLRKKQEKMNEAELRKQLAEERKWRERLDQDMKQLEARLREEQQQNEELRQTQTRLQHEIDELKRAKTKEKDEERADKDVSKEAEQTAVIRMKHLERELEQEKRRRTKAEELLRKQQEHQLNSFEREKRMLEDKVSLLEAQLERLQPNAEQTISKQKEKEEKRKQKVDEVFANENNWGSGMRIKSLFWDPKRQRGMDEASIEELNHYVIKVLFSSSKLSFSDIMKLNETFVLDYGRRQFVYVIKQVVFRLPELCLSTFAFDMMLYLMHRCLYEMDNCAIKDRIGARILMAAASRLYRDDNGLFRYISEYIKDFNIWKDMTFWEEFFWDEVVSIRRGSNSYEQLPTNEDDAEEQQLTDTIENFIYNMLNWKVPLNHVSEFVAVLCDTNRLPSVNKAELLAKACSFNPETEEKKKINSENKTELPASAVPSSPPVPVHHHQKEEAEELQRPPTESDINHNRKSFRQKMRKKMSFTAAKKETMS
ncbi:LIM domain protein 3 [Balamuthia mandrillaris]